MCFRCAINPAFAETSGPSYQDIHPRDHHEVIPVVSRRPTKPTNAEKEREKKFMHNFRLGDLTFVFDVDGMSIGRRTGQVSGGANGRTEKAGVTGNTATVKNSISPAPVADVYIVRE